MPKDPYLNLFSLPFNNVGATKIICNELLPNDKMFFEEKTSTLYHNMPYKILLFVKYKDDFDKGLEECFKYASEKLFRRIKEMK